MPHHTQRTFLPHALPLSVCQAVQQALISLTDGDRRRPVSSEVYPRKKSAPIRSLLRRLSWAFPACQVLYRLRSALTAHGRQYRGTPILRSRGPNPTSLLPGARSLAEPVLVKGYEPLAFPGRLNSLVHGGTHCC